MAVLRFLRKHIDSVVALLLTAAFVVEISLADESVVGASWVEELQSDDLIGLVAGGAFLVSLALRTSLPLLPLVMAVAATVLLGSGLPEDLASLALGTLLMSYSVGAWAGGRSGQLGALGIGLLAGTIAIRALDAGAVMRDLALPLSLVVGAWAVGLAVRSWRAARNDERVVGELDWEQAAGGDGGDAQDDTVRELRDVVERAMSAVIMQARSVADALDRDPSEARRSLAVIESASTEALEETQRLTGLLLVPDGAPLPEPQPGLGDLDFLAEQVSSAGLPVDMRVEGRPLPLTSDLDGAAFRVIHASLMATLDHASATQAHVVVRYETDEIQVEVTDDGLALEDDDADAQTEGLKAARKEVAGLGGTLDAGPGEDGGYWVLARFPFEPTWD